MARALTPKTAADRTSIVYNATPVLDITAFGDDPKGHLTRILSSIDSPVDSSFHDLVWKRTSSSQLYRHRLTKARPRRRYSGRYDL